MSEELLAGRDTQLAEIAFKRIYADILAGVLKPGAQISEVEMTEIYSLTRASARHAMVRLAHADWLLAVPRRGYVVRPLKLRDVREVFDLRRQLEPECARRAAGRVPATELTALDATTQLPFDPDDRQAEDAFFEANIALHTAIARAAGNQRIAELIERLHHETSRILRVGMRYANWSRNWQHGHAELIEALTCGEDERAAAVALRQINASERVVMDALTAQLDHIGLG